MDAFNSDIGGGPGGRAWPAAQAGVADSEASRDSEAIEAAAAVPHRTDPGATRLIIIAALCGAAGAQPGPGRARTVSAEPQRVSTGSSAILRREESPTHP
jgi:hypothetical protein